MKHIRFLLFALTLSVVCLVAQVTPIAHACYKEAELIRTEDGDMRIEVGENVVWLMHISVSNWRSSGDYTDIKVKDNLGAELEIDSPFNMTQGSVSVRLTGKSEKVHLLWFVGTLAPGERAHLYFLVSTDHNPAGKQCYTSPGRYELNSGPTMKYMWQGHQHSYEADSIWITVHTPD
jgi:hypothetical protein